MNRLCRFHFSRLRKSSSIFEVAKSDYHSGVEEVDNIELNCQMAHQQPNTQKMVDGRPQDNYLSEFRHELQASIVDCVKHHRLLIEFVKMIEDFFSTFMLIKSLQTTFQLCNALFTFLTVMEQFS